MTEIQDQPTETQPAPRRPRRGWMLAVGVAVAVAGGTVAAVVTSPAPAPATFTLQGTVSMLNSGGLLQANGDGGCYGISSYSDIRSGAPVTVQDESGRTVATGTLGTSKVDVTPQTGFVWGCDMHFAVAGVPDGHPQYSVSVAYRSPQMITSDEAHAYGATLNI